MGEESWEQVNHDFSPCSRHSLSWGQKTRPISVPCFKWPSPQPHPSRDAGSPSPAKEKPSCDSGKVRSEARVESTGARATDAAGTSPNILIVTF